MKEVGIVQKREVTSGDTGGKEWQRVAVTVNNKHFSSFNAADALINEGDTVEIEYDTKGKYNNIKTMKVVESGKTIPNGNSYEPKVDTNKRIARMASLNTAISLLDLVTKIHPEVIKETFNKQPPVDVIIDLATILESWIYKD